MPAQFKAFWDHAGKQWQNGSYWVSSLPLPLSTTTTTNFFFPQGKYCGVFVSTATAGGGQESTVISSMSTFAHHGIIYVPLGYKTVGALLSNLDEVRGGSPWGAGTFAGSDGSRQPTNMELQVAEGQGKAFYETVNKVSF